MEQAELSQEKIYGALRSVYRYREMTQEGAPDILIEAESELMEKRFALLSAQEIFELIKLWPEYLAEQSAFDVIDNQRFQQYLQTVN